MSHTQRITRAVYVSTASDARVVSFSFELIDNGTGEVVGSFDIESGSIIVDAESAAFIDVLGAAYASTQSAALIAGTVDKSELTLGTVSRSVLNTRGSDVTFTETYTT